MDIEPETIYQVLLAGGSVVVFVVGAVVVSLLYGTNGDLRPAGGVALVGTIGLFILVMLLSGLWLERQEFPEQSAAEQDPNGPDASVGDRGQRQEH